MKNRTEEIIAQLIAEFDGSVNRLKDAIRTYTSTGTPPDPKMRTDGSFAYPEIIVRYSGTELKWSGSLAFARLDEPGE